MSNSDTPGPIALREYYAGEALPAIIFITARVGLDFPVDEIARQCFEIADAMLAESAKARPADSTPT